MFKEIFKNIYKVDIPFDNITTSSFLVVNEGQSILVDCGTYPEDVTNIIIPSLNKLNIKPDYLFLTHFHGDHSGGTQTLFEALDGIKLLGFEPNLIEKFDGILLKNNDEIFKDIRFVSLPGHSSDSAALFDKRTNSVITGDSLQLWGITKYGCGISSPIEYKKSIARLKTIKPNNIFASHEYYPLGSTAIGKDSAKAYLDECDSFYNDIILFTLAAKNKGVLDFEKIAVEFQNSKMKKHPNMPKMPAHSFKAILAQDEDLLRQYIV